MKKILSFFTLILTIALIYGYSRSVQFAVAGNNPVHAVAEKNEIDTAPGSRQGIMYVLTADKSKPGWSSSFLRNYIYGNTNKDGC